MPTGYTAPLHDGEPITFEQFALRCSRAMGAAIMQRDESIEVEIREREVEPYYFENVEKARAALDDALAVTEQGWLADQIESIAKAEAYRTEYREKKAAMRERYDAMLERVLAWAPPTGEHQGLKDFMVEQIKQSIDFDCSGSYEPEVPAPVSAGTYRAREIARLTKTLQHATESYAKQSDLAESQNAWLRALRDSLKETK